MSRFNNTKVLSPAAPPPDVRVTRAVSPTFVVNQAFRLGPPPRDPALAFGLETGPSMAQAACFFVVCVYLLSGSANDLIYHFTHGETHVSAVCVLLLPILFLCTGGVFRGFRIPAGICLAGFGVWLLVASPFSVYKGGSALLMLNYIPRSFLVCFYLAACAVTVRQVRTVVRVIGACALVVVLSCFAFGGYVDGRYSIPDSLFFSNANDLALQLLLGMVILMYSFFEKNRVAWVVSALGILGSLLYLAKTGSRAALVATLATGVAVFFLSRFRVTMLAVAIPAMAIAFVLAPSDVQHRITLLVTDPGEVTNSMDASAVLSQMQRTRLLETSIQLAITNPLFGVGPGQFIVKQATDAEKEGERAQWRVTHNSYTEAASEAGLPAFAFYVGTILACLRMNYRLYRKSVRRRGLEQVAGMSFCMFISTFAFAIDTFFVSQAYGSFLPLLAGVSIALYLSSKPLLERQEQAYASGAR